MQPKKENFAIVGGGLVGSLLAAYLGRAGHQVEVFERRPDLRTTKINAGRSINLAISTRGLHALAEVGLSHQVFQHTIAMSGRHIHHLNGQASFQPYGKTPSESIHSISRADLNKLLMSHAEATGHVRFHFEQRLIGIDAREQSLSFMSERDQSEKTLHFSRVFATDGAFSVVRQSIIQQQSQSHLREDSLDHGYKELIMPPNSTNSNGGYAMDKNGLHIWPRGSYMLIALPNLGGSFTCTLFLPFKGPHSFEQLRSSHAVEEFFHTEFPDALALIPDLSEQFFANPTGKMVTVRTAPWHLDSMCLMLGDAAHAIVPFFGQGMNCGFEDCSLLDKMLKEMMASSKAHDGDWLKLFQSFEGLRRPNTDGIATMAIENFVEMRDKVGQPQFLLRKEIERILERDFPNDFVSRYALVSFSRAPYSQAYRLGQLQESILDQLCQNLKDAKELDLSLAKTLIQTKLSPMMGEIARQQLS